MMEFSAGRFSVCNDCVSFRGYAINRRYPWFDKKVGDIVSKYLSGGGLSVSWSDEKSTFIAGNSGRTMLLDKLRIDGVWHYYFGGLWIWDICK